MDYAAVLAWVTRRYGPAGRARRVGGPGSKIPKQPRRYLVGYHTDAGNVWTGTGRTWREAMAEASRKPTPPGV